MFSLFMTVGLAEVCGVAKRGHCLGILQTSKHYTLTGTPFEATASKLQFEGEAKKPRKPSGHAELRTWPGDSAPDAWASACAKDGKLWSGLPAYFTSWTAKAVMQPVLHPLSQGFASNMHDGKCGRKLGWKPSDAHL